MPAPLASIQADDQRSIDYFNLPEAEPQPYDDYWKLPEPESGATDGLLSDGSSPTLPNDELSIFAELFFPLLFSNEFYFNLPMGKKPSKPKKPPIFGSASKQRTNAGFGSKSSLCIAEYDVSSIKAYT